MIFEKLNKNNVAILTNYVCEYLPNSKLLDYEETSVGKRFLYGYNGTVVFRILVYNDGITRILLDPTSFQSSVALEGLKDTLTGYLTTTLRDLSIKQILN